MNFYKLILEPQFLEKPFIFAALVSLFKLNTSLETDLLPLHWIL